MIKLHSSVIVFCCFYSVIFISTGDVIDLSKCVKVNVTFCYGKLPSDFYISKSLAENVGETFVPLIKNLLSTTCPDITVACGSTFQPSVPAPYWITTLEFKDADKVHEVDDVLECLENSGIFQPVRSSLKRISKVHNTSATNITNGNFKIYPQCCGRAVCKTRCDPNPCNFGNICTDNGTSFTCICAPGFKGHLCDKEAVQDQSNRINIRHRITVILVLVIVFLFLMSSCYITSVILRKRQQQLSQKREKGSKQCILLPALKTEKLVEFSSLK